MNELKCLVNKNRGNHYNSGNDLAEGYELGFEEGFKKAFEIINEELEKEMKQLNEYPWMGERIFAIKKYQEKVNKVLKDMEKKE